MEAVTLDVTSGRRQRAATRTEARVLLAFAAVLIVGLFSDGWAHANILDDLERFVTPWHAIVFVGYALTAGWLLRMIQRRRRPGQPLREAVPVGHELAAIAIVTFAIGFNGDAIWHTVFGLEADIDALLSPTHLLMAASLLAIVSTPFRTRPATTPRQTWAGDATRVASLLLTTLVAGFFLLYLWIPSFDIGSVGYRDWLARLGAPDFLTEVSQMTMLASSFVITVLLLVPALLLSRTVRPPVGSLFVLAVVPAVAIAGIRELSNPESLLAFVVGGVVAEVVAATVTAPRRRLLTLGAAVPFALWSTYWVVFALAHGAGWEVELYTGQVVSAVLVGLGLAALVARPVHDHGGTTDVEATADPATVG